MSSDSDTEMKALLDTVASINKRHEGISLTTFSIVTIALGLWLLYGILIESMAMIIANVMTLSVIFAVILGVVKLRKLESGD